MSTHLLLEPADTFHRKLVQIGTDNGDEFQSFEQRIVFILGLG